MDQQPASRQVTPAKIRMLRHAALVGAPLLMLSSIVWPDLGAGQSTLHMHMIALVLLVIGLLTFLDPSVKLRHPRNLAIITVIAAFAAILAGFFLWRAGRIVAEATYNPGIAPFDITVREVPVPVTHSHHFIITLKRGQYPVTSFRYFWLDYTPKRVRIEWTRLEEFKVLFDERYVATCDWHPRTRPPRRPASVV